MLKKKLENRTSSNSSSVHAAIGVHYVILGPESKRERCELPGNSLAFIKIHKNIKLQQTTTSCVDKKGETRGVITDGAGENPGL